MLKHQSGLTVIELAISMMLIGLIFILTVPNVLNSSSINSALYRSKNFSSDLMNAKQIYVTQTPTGVPGATDLAGLTHYTTILKTGQPMGSTGPTCSSAVPCYLYSDGSVLYPGFPAGAPMPVFGTAYNSGSTSPLGFVYDPDGSGNMLPVTFVLDWNTERLASYDAYCTTTGVTCSAVSQQDPSYIKIWTQMK